MTWWQWVIGIAEFATAAWLTDWTMTGGIRRRRARRAQAAQQFEQMMARSQRIQAGKPRRIVDPGDPIYLGSHIAALQRNAWERTDREIAAAFATPPANLEDDRVNVRVWQGNTVAQRMAAARKEVSCNPIFAGQGHIDSNADAS